MPTPAEYEELVEGLLKLAVERDGYENLQTHRLKKYRGKSGHDHEIDVSFELTIADLRFLVLVECKRYRRRVGIDDVMEFAYRVRDIGANKGVIVTTCGYQDGAIDVAKTEGIGLLIAARGEMHAYMGARYTVWKYWLDSLFFQADERTRQLRLFPRRVAAGNHHAYISAIDDKRGGELVFVLPSDLPEADVSLFDIPDGQVVQREEKHEWGTIRSSHEYRNGHIEMLGGRLEVDEINEDSPEVPHDQEPIA